MGTDFPSGNILNATMKFFISLDMASAHRVLPFLASRVRAYSTVLGSSIPNSWLLFRYLVCHFLMLVIIVSLFFSTYLTQQLKAGSSSIPYTAANSAVCTGWNSVNSDNFSHEVELSFHWQQICQLAVVFWVTGLPCTVICSSGREMALLSLQ